MRNLALLTTVFLWSSGASLAQTSFNFLKMPTNARMAALGGVNVSLAETDVNLVFSNPALISGEWHNRAAVSYSPYYADISVSSVAYARDLEKHGAWAAGLYYLDMGRGIRMDDAGMETGEFSARQYYFVVGRSHKAGAFQAGMSLKWAASMIDSYQAHALLVDIGGVFRHPERQLSVGLAIKNAGILLDDYSEFSASELPLDVQLGVTIKPEHMPVRFSVTGHHLSQWNILYENDDDASGNNNESPGTVDYILSHVNVGAEVLISKNFEVRGGYNRLINSELSLSGVSRGTGFSYGFLLRIKAFELAFSRSVLHVSGGKNFFSLQSDLNKFFKKEKE